MHGLVEVRDAIVSGRRQSNTIAAIIAALAADFSTFLAGFPRQPQWALAPTDFNSVTDAWGARFSKNSGGGNVEYVSVNGTSLTRNAVFIPPTSSGATELVSNLGTVNLAGSGGFTLVFAMKGDATEQAWPGIISYELAGASATHRSVVLAYKTSNNGTFETELVDENHNFYYGSDQLSHTPNPEVGAWGVYALVSRWGQSGMRDELYFNGALVLFHDRLYSNSMALSSGVPSSATMSVTLADDNAHLDPGWNTIHAGLTYSHVAYYSTPLSYSDAKDLTAANGMVPLLTSSIPDPGLVA